MASAAERLATTNAAAPSEICDEFPAVSVPSEVKALRSLANLSAVIPGRMPSSAAMVTGLPRRWGTSTATTSREQWPGRPGDDSLRTIRPAERE